MNAKKRPAYLCKPLTHGNIYVENVGVSMLLPTAYRVGVFSYLLSGQHTFSVFCTRPLSFIDQQHTVCCDHDADQRQDVMHGHHCRPSCVVNPWFTGSDNTSDQGVADHIRRANYSAHNIIGLQVIDVSCLDTTS